MLTIIEKQDRIVISGRTPTREILIELTTDGEPITSDVRALAPDDVDAIVGPAIEPAVGERAPSPVRKQITPWRMLTGAVGLLKAEFGINAVDDATYARRKAVCLGCDKYDFGVCGRKSGCQCYLAAKIRIRGESCPDQKW